MRNHLSYDDRTYYELSSTYSKVIPLPVNGTKPKQSVGKLDGLRKKEKFFL